MKTRRMITLSCAALAMGVALASVSAFAPAVAATKHHHKAHAKVAQGPAGLNGGNAAGSGYAPWAGPANGLNNPISGSGTDPGMHRPLKPQTPTPAPGR